MKDLNSKLNELPAERAARIRKEAKRLRKEYKKSLQSQKS